jgi:hypothetical protein
MILILLAKVRRITVQRRHIREHTRYGRNSSRHEYRHGRVRLQGNAGKFRSPPDMRSPQLLCKSYPVSPETHLLEAMIKGA